MRGGLRALKNVGLSRFGRGVHGNIDRVENGVLIGWAARRGSRQPLELDVLVDGTPRVTGILADQYRVDLREAGIGDGNHGYVADLGPVAEGTVIETVQSGTGRTVSRHRFGAGPSPSHADNDGRGEPDPETERRTVEAIAAEIDLDFYRRQPGAEAPETPDDAARHYVAHWAQASLDPTPGFSTSYYVAANPDVAASGINPFFHYLVAGRHERRLPSPPGGARARKLRELVPLAQTRKEWREAVDPAPQLLDRTALATSDQLRTAIGHDQWLLTVCHDDYLTNSGGIQLCVQSEVRAALDAELGSVVVAPWFPLPTLAAEDERTLLRLFAQNRFLGVVDPADLAGLLADAPARRTHASVHSLLGHKASDVADLIEAAGTATNHYWLHDHLTLCEGFSLQRNDVAYCGAPPPDAPACRICVYGKRRREHLDEMQDLFARISFAAVAPSDFQKDFWRSRSDLKFAELLVHPHARLDRRGPAFAAAGGPLRIAYLGWPADYKGWGAFSDLAGSAPGQSQLEFHYFGTARPDLPGLVLHDVAVTADNREAMVDALCEQGIDIVLHWAGSPETFSFSTHEALAADTLVVTGPVSGNIRRIADTDDRVVVFEDRDTLRHALDDGALARRALDRRSSRRRARLRFSGCTVDLLPETVDA